MKHKFFVSPNRVVCVSTFAGKRVRGVAKCNACDEFSLPIGKSLAMIRCDLKIAYKRLNRANMKYQEALDCLEKAKKHCEAMAKYKFDATEEIAELEEELNNLLERI